MSGMRGADRATFRVGVTRDLRGSEGQPFADIGLDVLDGHGEISWDFLAEDADVLTPELAAGFDALFVGRSAVPAAAVERNDALVLLARWGVGFEKIDVAACTRSGVAISLAPDGVRRPVAVAALTLVLALSQNLVHLDRLTRAGRWDDRRTQIGVGLVGRTVGIVGLGNIGGELVRLLAPFDVEVIASDPWVDGAAAGALGARLVSLDELLARSDFVVLLCPLTEITHHLIDADALTAMQPGAFLVNVSRGGVVDHRALVEALSSGVIRGAGIDVFENEPLRSDDPILALDNAIVTPHALCWTDQCLRDCGVSAWLSVLAVAGGREPDRLADRSVLENPRFREALRRRTNLVGTETPG
jgi:D-3-phosphoglycerate dehydrogenase